MSNNNENTPNKRKKGPGRPRKNPPKKEIPRHGIAQEPNDIDDVVEFIYSIPIIMKKIIVFFKNLSAAQIQILFRKEDIIFYALDHHEESKIRVRIDGKKLNHYYCKKEVNIGVNCKELELILNKVDKEYNSIFMMLTKGKTQEHITLFMENEIEIEETHIIDLIGQYKQITADEERDFCDEDYTVKFKMPGKYFRKLINDIKTISTELSFIQDDKREPLELSYISKNKKVRSKHIIKNSKHIKLYSKLSSNDTFRVTVKLDSIKPISSAHIADELVLLVDENRKFMTKALLDNGAIEIKTLTNIIDQRI